MSLLLTKGLGGSTFQPAPGFCPILDLRVEFSLRHPLGFMVEYTPEITIPSGFQVSNAATYIQAPRGVYIIGHDPVDVPSGLHVENTDYVAPPSGFSVEETI